MKIGFNKPYSTGKETVYIADALLREKISGNGYYTSLCHQFFEHRYQFKKALLTSSCTDALEMAALLLDIQPGDEVIIPSYTFVSTANAFILRGATIVFADSCTDLPNIDPASIESLSTSKTKAIVVVHYAGVACKMDEIMALAEKNNLFVVEDAAQAIDSYYNERPLGSIGHIGCFSFHETKNITCGEGGLLVINDSRFLKRAEVIWEKGTNRAAFFRGEMPEDGWIDIGSSFLASDIAAAFLCAQLQELEHIQSRRKRLWNYYYDRLKDYPQISLPCIPSYSSNNAHLFYIRCKDFSERNKLITYLKSQSVQAITHYLPLHKSPYFSDRHDGRLLKNSANHSDRNLRLPLYVELTASKQDYIIDNVVGFLTGRSKNTLYSIPVKRVKTPARKSSYFILRNNEPLLKVGDRS